MKERFKRRACMMLLLTLALVPAKISGAPGDKLWELPLSIAIRGVPTLATNGDLLVTTEEGHLCAVSYGGTEVWRFRPQARQSALGSATVADDGTIYYGSDNLYALNPNGSKRWEFSDREPFTGYYYYITDPVVGPDGVIYAARYTGNSEQRLYAINPDGSLRWKIKARFKAPPVMGADGTLYVPEEYGGLSAVNPDGVVRWQIDIGNSISGSATPLPGGTILVPVSGSSIVEGSVQALTKTGAKLWEFQGGSEIWVSPVVGPDGTIYCVFARSRVVALETNGQPRWEYQIERTADGYDFPTAPAVAADRTLYVNGGHKLHALGPEGQLLWKYDIGVNGGGILIGPDGTVFFSANGTTGMVYAVEGTGAPLADSPWPMIRRDSRHRGSLMGAFVLPPAAPTNFTASMETHTDQVLLQWDTVMGAAHYQVLRALTSDLSQAVVISSAVAGASTFSDRTAVAQTTYYYYVRAVNSAGQSGVTGPVQGRRRLARTGEIAWILPTQGPIGSSPAIGADGSVYVCSSDGYLYATTPDGAEKWKFHYGGASSSSPSIGADGTIYFTSTISRYPMPETNAIYSVRSTGELRWRELIGLMRGNGVAIGADGTLYSAIGDYDYGSEPCLRALSPQGSNLWTFANGRIFNSTPVIGADGTIYAATTEGFVTALRPDGALLWECGTGDGSLKTPVIDSNGVLFTAGVKIHAINSDGQKLWSYALQAGSSAGPCCLDGVGNLYAQGDYSFYRVRADGTSGYKYSLPDGMDRTFNRVIRDANGMIYASVFNGIYADMITGRVYAMSSNEGRAWGFSKYRVEFGGGTLSADGILCVPASDGNLYGFRAGAGPAVSAWPHPLHDAQHTARATQAAPAPDCPQPSATFRTRVTDVRVVWNPVIGASGYQVFRAATSQVEDAVLIAELTGRVFYDDNTALPETGFTYWVKAKNAWSTSSFSPPVTGMRRQAVAGELLREWSLSGEIDTSPAIGDDGTIYVCVNSSSSSVSDPNRKVVALRPDGGVLWQYTSAGAKLTSPTIGSDRTLYVGIRGSLYTFPYASPLLALNEDGTKRWEFMTSDAIEATPALAKDGTIYIGTASGSLHAINPEGQSLWATSLGEGIGSIAVGRDGTIYALATRGRLYAVTALGRKIWENPTGGSQISGSMAIMEDGLICVPTEFAGLKLFNTDGTLYRQVSTGDFSATPVIGTNGSIVIGDRTGFLWFFEAAGTNFWRTNSGAGFYRAAAVSSSGAVLAGNYAGKLMAVSHRAEKTWEHSAQTAMKSSPAIAPDGTIYIGSGGKLVSVFGSGSLAETSWPMFQHDARHTGRDDTPASLPAASAAVAASDGAFNDRVRVSWATTGGACFYRVWRHTIDRFEGSAMIADTIAAQTFYDDKTARPGTHYFYWVQPVNGTGSGEAGQSDAGFRRVPAPGELLGDSRLLGAAVCSPALGLDGKVYASGSGRMYALNPDLTEAWYFNHGTIGTPSIGLNGIIYFWSSDSRFYGLNSDGVPSYSLVGSYDLSLPAAVASESGIIIASKNRTVSCYDPSSESWRWQYLVSNTITAAPALGGDGSVYFGTEEGQLYALRADGSLQWRYRTGGRIRSSPAVGADGTVYFGSDDGGIYAIGPDGRRRWAALTGGSVNASPAITPENTVIVGSQDRKLYAFGPDGTKRWEFPAESAIQSSACVGADGMIYFGTYGGWVYGVNRDGAKVWAVNSATNPVTGRVVDSPLLTENYLLVPFSYGAIQAFHVSAGPATVNWPQYRANAQRTARAGTWLAVGPTLGIAFAASGRWRLEAPTIVGRRYQLERSTNLRTWEAVFEPVTATNSSQIWIEANRISEATFYRVKMQP